MESSSDETEEKTVTTVIPEPRPPVKPWFATVAGHVAYFNDAVITQMPSPTCSRMIVEIPVDSPDERNQLVKMRTKYVVQLLEQPEE